MAQQPSPSKQPYKEDYKSPKYYKSPIKYEISKKIAKIVWFWLFLLPLCINFYTK